MGKWTDCKNCGSRIFIQEVETKFGKKWIPFQELATLHKDENGRFTQMEHIMVEHGPFCGNSPQRRKRRPSSHGQGLPSQTQSKQEAHQAHPGETDYSRPPRQEAIPFRPGEHTAYKPNGYDREQ